MNQPLFHCPKTEHSFRIRHLRAQDLFVMAMKDSLGPHCCLPEASHEIIISMDWFSWEHLNWKPWVLLHQIWRGLRWNFPFNQSNDHRSKRKFPSNPIVAGQCVHSLAVCSLRGLHRARSSPASWLSVPHFSVYLLVSEDFLAISESGLSWT